MDRFSYDYEVRVYLGRISVVEAMFIANSCPDLYLPTVDNVVWVSKMQIAMVEVAKIVQGKSIKCLNVTIMLP